MNTKAKYSLILISTLLMGMIIGFLVGGRITSNRINKMRSYYTNKGFNRQIIKIIKPTPEQRPFIIPILKKYAAINHQLLTDFREGQIDTFIDLKNELETYLNENQIARLNTALEKRNKRFNHNPINNKKWRLKQDSIKNKYKRTKAGCVKKK